MVELAVIDHGSAPAARRASRPELTGVIDRLILEFEEQMSPGAVLGRVIRCRETLLRQGIRAELASATEASARVALRGLAPG